MRPAVKRLLLAAVFFLASGYCLVGIAATASLSAFNDPTAPRRAYTWLAGAVILGIAGLWQVVVLVKKHGRENLL